MDVEDEDIARAIALSLQDQNRKRPEVIRLDDEEEPHDDEEARFQEQLRFALEASKAESARQSSSSMKSNQPIAQTQPVMNSVLTSFLSERTQLERERRERQKRFQKQTDIANSSDHEGSDDSDDDQPPAKRQQISSSSSFASRSAVAGSSRLPQEGTANDQHFWDAEFRQTATQHADPRADGKPTFRLTEILGKTTDLAFAIMSSYALDFPWIYQFFDPSVPVIMIAQPDASGQASIKNVLPHWIKATPFLRNGFGCQHMKFMILFHKTGRLRVVISTANLIAYDWRDMENTVWLQDIPPRAKPVPHDEKADDFPGILQRMLASLNVIPALKAMISDNHPHLPIQSIDELRQRWDWSKVKAHLIPSIAGKHEGWTNVLRTGHPRLMMAVRKIGMRTGKGKQTKDLILEYQGSSLGNFTTQWLNEFHWSARGESAEDWLDEPKKRREKLPYPPVKIIFPTKKTVQQTTLGEKGGGTIFCRRKQWSTKNFPRDHFYDSKSKGGPVLMHSKMIVAVLRENSLSHSKNKQPDNSDTESDSDDDIEIVEPAAGWAYLGSHNFTPSAWGTLSGSSFNPILNISNYEVGVVFPLKDGAEADRMACWQRPPKKYVTGRDEPWIQEESSYHQEE